MTSEERDAQAELRAACRFRPGKSSGIWMPWYESNHRGGRDRRDVTATGGVGGSEGGITIGNAVPEIGTAFRDAFVLEKLGARVIAGLTDDVTFPRGSATINAEWVSETAGGNKSSVTFDGLDLTPRRVTASIRVSRQLLLQPAMEPYLRGELTAALATEVQRVAVAGTGASNQPQGIVYAPGIGLVEGGPDGAAPTYENLTEMEYHVTGVKKADRGHLAWLVSPLGRRKLRNTPIFSGGDKPVWPENSADQLLGHASGVISAVPDNLTKGASAGNCSALIFGEMSELIVGFWGPGIMVDAATDRAEALAGWVWLIASAYVNTGYRNGSAWAAMLDALCASAE